VLLSQVGYSSSFSAGAKMPSMKRIARFLTVASWLICVNALSQTNQEKPVETNACDIANNPVQFKGKLVQVRAQIWPVTVTLNGTMLDEYVLNGSTKFVGGEARSCRFLSANFLRPNGLYGHTYFGTFTGRVVGNNQAVDSLHPWRPSSRSAVMLLIESQADIHGEQDYLNGLVKRPQIYDQRSRSFITPE
jgi:hypothetical protein